LKEFLFLLSAVFGADIVDSAVPTRTPAADAAADAAPCRGHRLVFIIPQSPCFKHDPTQIEDVRVIP
jgi:hypothetical protein